MFLSLGLNPVGICGRVSGVSSLVAGGPIADGQQGGSRSAGARGTGMFVGVGISCLQGEGGDVMTSSGRRC